MQRTKFSIIFLSFLCAIQIKGMPSPFNANAIVFCGNANPQLGSAIANHLGVDLGKAKIDRFNDGEIQIRLDSNVRNKDIFIIQPMCRSSLYSINDIIIELLLLIRTLKRSSAGNINVVVPYYGYARQDRKVKSRVPISASDFAFFLEKAGATRIITIDLHCNQIQGFFQHIPVDNLYASVITTQYIAQKYRESVVVVSPDAGGVERATQFVHDLAKKNIAADMAVISKRREKAGVVSSMELIGSVKDATAIIVDDLCDTGGTLVKAAELLKSQGAKKVIAVITHPVFSHNALTVIGESVIDEIIITDTIPLRGDAPANMTVLSVASLLADAIFRIELGESVSALFR